MQAVRIAVLLARGFSALQRAEIAEISPVSVPISDATGFSALQRAEIAEIEDIECFRQRFSRFSALQRAEIAEIILALAPNVDSVVFQCSSTSRNC